MSFILYSCRVIKLLRSIERRKLVGSWRQIQPCYVLCSSNSHMSFQLFFYICIGTG